MSPLRPRIAVCICTFKRPDMLARLLRALRTLEHQDLRPGKGKLLQVASFAELKKHF